MRIANFAAFEIDDEVLGNLREYALANSLYWVSTPQSMHWTVVDISRLWQKATLASSPPVVTLWM